MRYLLVVMAALLCASAFALDGGTREWRFDVSLDGRRIGEHRFVLRERADWHEITSEADFRVRVLGIEAYRYAHRAREWWRGDCLEQLDAVTDENGRKTRVSFPDAGVPRADCVRTFAYWNMRILESRRLLNPQTGEYVEVMSMPMGKEAIGGRPVEHYRLLGSGPEPLEIDLWYTAAGEWMALESRTPSGHRLRYARK